MRNQYERIFDDYDLLRISVAASDDQIASMIASIS